MNATIDNILNRKSIRAYTDQPVSKADLDLILQCGLRAATSRNRQPWHFTVIESRNVLDEISAKNKAIFSASDDEAARQMAADPNFDSFRGAPMCVIVSGANSEPNTIADCANAVENMAIAAKSLNLGSCYIASFKVCLLGPGGESLRSELGIPDGYVPHYALSIGHSADDPRITDRNMDVINYVK